MIRPIAILCSAILVALVAAVPAWSHGSANTDFETKILSIEPSGLPVDVRIVGGDQVRFENQGDQELVLCGYEPGECEQWVRIGPKGVFVDHDARSYFANVDATEYGEVPDDAGSNPDWQRVRERPAFYTYHDHRVHWMGLSLPPNVDQSKGGRQTIFESALKFRYGTTDGTVRTRLDYVGGAPWAKRHAEQLIVGFGVVAMLVVFVLDARRRRRLSGGTAQVAE
ncbi:MAG: hypothetical protein KDC46_07800 [Thermoleophilia bacterium]|nr:hypothetical protein [Thermoleophilia bacterium]